MPKTLVSFAFSSGPAAVILPMTVYVRPSQSYMTTAGRVVIDGPGPVPLNENGEGSALLETGYVWEFHISVPGKTTRVWKYIPAEAPPAVAYSDLISVSAPPASGEDAPGWVLTVHAEYTRVMEVYDALQETAADLPENLRESQQLRDETQKARDEAVQAASNSRGRVEFTEDGWARVAYPYDSGATPAPNDGSGSGVIDWANVTGKPNTFLPIIGPDADQAVAGNDYRLENARTPTAHGHSIAEVDGLGQALESRPTAAVVEDALSRRAPLASPDFTGAPTADYPVEATGGRAVATVDWVRSNYQGTGGEIPKATADTAGVLQLGGQAFGEIGGDSLVQRVLGWETVIDQVSLDEALERYAPLNDSGLIPAEYLTLAPQGEGGGGGDMGALRPESFTGTAAERIEKALVAADAQGRSVFIAADTKLDRGIVVSNINVNLWGPAGTRLILPSAVGSAFSCIHTTRDHFAVKSVRRNTWGWSGASKPDNSESVRVSEIIPQSQADLSKIVAGDTWRVENKWAGDKYEWSEEVGGTVLKGTHAPVRGVMFNVDMVVGQLFTEGDTVVQKNTAGVTVASGVLKGFQKTALDSSKRTTKGQILFESLTGTFSGAVTGNPGTLLVNGVTIATIVKDPVSDEYGSVLINGIGIEDTYTNNPSSATPTIVMRRLPKFRFSMVGLSFDVDGNPEDNTTRTDRSTSVMLGNIIAPRLDITVRNAWAAAVTIAGCPNRSVRLHVLEGPNDARFQSPTIKNSAGQTVPNPEYSPLNDIGAWGYGLVTYGACDGGKDWLRGGHLRHLFTTNPDERGTHPLDATSTSAFSLAATGTSRDCVTEMFAYDCYSSAYNSHEGCLRMVLQNFYIQGSMSGGQKDSGESAVALRSFAHIVRDGIIVGSKAGVKVASNHIAGSPIKDHTIVENVHFFGVQEYAVNTGNKPAESANHKVSILRNRMNDSGFAKSQPWDSSGVLLSAVDTDVFDNYIGRFNHSPIRLISSTPASGVTPKIRIRRNEFDYSEVVNSSTNKANGIDLSNTTGYVFETGADNTVTPKGTGTARQPSYFMVNRSGNGRFTWPESGYIQSSGEAVPVFTATGGTPTHAYIARAAVPTPTA